MYTQKRLSMTAAVIVLGTVVGLTQHALAAPSVVPNEWNVHSNFKLGAYLQPFESETKPDWVGTLGSLVAQDSHVNPLSPARSNIWFASNANTNVLELATDDAAITNALVPDVGSVVSFAADPVYVDMRIKFVVQAEAPPTIVAKLAIYASKTNELTVVRHNGSTVCAVQTDLTTTWHQLTVKMKATGKFDVLLDDASVATDLTLIGAPVDDKLNSVVFSGTGFIDELYVSHGNPAYTNIMGAIPAKISEDGLDTEASVNNWLAGLIYSGALTTGTTFPSFTKTQLDNAYLLNALSVNDGVASPPGEATLGIQSFELVDATHMDVTVYLKVGETLKDGKINGRIQLQGKVNKADENYTLIGSAISPALMDFDDGTATYTFTLPSNPVYRFFKPTIIE
jgi:hypothetical protein